MTLDEALAQWKRDVAAPNLNELNQIVYEGNRTERGRAWLEARARGLAVLEASASKSDSPDALFDTSDAAMSARIAALRACGESRLDRALYALVCGCQDLKDAIWQAGSKDELREARRTIWQIGQYLDTAESIMLGCEEHWKDPR